MIIGLTGYIGSGKGTVADILVKKHGYRSFAFADTLKDAVSVIFGWDRHLLEGNSNASRAFRERIDPWWSHKLGYEVTPRLMLQRMGTEACRDIIGNNIWIAALERRLQDEKKVVIHDARFVNEISFIRSLGGSIIRIDRDKKTTVTDRHVSETDWNDILPDAIIENTGSVQDLENEVTLLLTNLEKPYKLFHTL